MKHINNGFAYISDEKGKVHSVSWQVEVSLAGVEVTHFLTKEVKHPDYDGLQLEALSDGSLKVSNG